MFFAVAHLLNLEVDLLLLHTTRTYFERDGEDDDAEDRWGLRRYGHSKDSRPDLPQIIIGLAVTREGIPVRIWCWPGNTSDQALPQVKDDLPTWRGGRVVTVVDRGFSSAADLADPGPRAGPAARGHPHRADRHGHPDHRADHRPAGHSSRLRAHPAAPDHRSAPGLTCTNASIDAAGACSDTPRTPAQAHRRSSTPGFGHRGDLTNCGPRAPRRVIPHAQTRLRLASDAPETLK